MSSPDETIVVSTLGVLWVVDCIHTRVDWQPILTLMVILGVAWVSWRSMSKASSRGIPKDFDSDGGIDWRETGVKVGRGGLSVRMRLWVNEFDVEKAKPIVDILKLLGEGSKRPKELRAALGITSVNFFTARYLTPLVEAGYIAPEDNASANSPNRKNKLTQNGIMMV